MNDPQNQQWSSGGRPASWRFGMIAGGVLVGGAGLALLLWPQILIWLLAGSLGSLGAFLVLSGICARGR